MAINRSRIPFSIEEYIDIQGKIVDRKTGLARNFIRDNYSIENGAFVSKNKISEITASKKAPVGVASKDPSEDTEEFKNYLCSNLGFIQENTTFLGDGGIPNPTRFNDLQSFIINSEDSFFWIKKSRQFGFSFAMSARSLAKAMLKLKHTTIFVSYNEEESKEKILYARELYDTLPMKWKLFRKLKYDNKTSLVFEKSGQNTSETRILSYPQRIIRGKGGELDIGLDEGAHCIHLRKIYTSALPALSRSKTSTLWMGSSPAGKSGLFYEVGINLDNNYSKYLRMTVPWWVIPEFSKDIATSRVKGWDMHTDERVSLFATDKIKSIRDSMPLDDFRQEYECEDLDEQYSYFPWDLINGCVPIFNIDAKNTPEFDSPAGDLKDGDASRSGVGIEHYNNFEDFLVAVRKGHFKGSLIGGFDVGRTNDASEIYYIEENPTTYHQTARCNISLKNVSLPEQRRITVEQFKMLGDKLIKFGVDNNGIGMNIAEDLEEASYEKVIKLNFNNNAWKEEACRNFKYRLSKLGISLPTDRGVLNQIHSIKRILLPGGIWRFDAEKAKKHHGDKFWALLGASTVGHSMEGDSEYTSFDPRAIKPNNAANQTVPQSAIISVESNASHFRFNPWGAMIPRMPSVNFGINNIGRMLETGLVNMGKELPFRK